MDSEEADQDGPVWLLSLTLCHGQVFHPNRGQCHTNSYFFFLIGCAGSSLLNGLSLDVVSGVTL